MNAFARARAWLRAVAFRGQVEHEMQEELAAHLAQAAERFCARGMTEADALAAARREFGHQPTIEQAGRDACAGAWIDGVLADLRYAFWHFARTPLATVTMVLTLGVGIGFSSAVFSVVSGVFLRPAQGVPDDPALVKIRGKTSAYPFARGFSFPELRAYAERSETFASVAAWRTAGAVADPGANTGKPVTADVQFVTPNFFATLGIQPAAGQWFPHARFDDLSAPEPAVVLNHAFAMELYGTPAAAVGRTMRVNGVEATIVGVAQPLFNGPQQARSPRRLWMPLASMFQVEAIKPSALADARYRAFDVFARLQPALTVDAAEPVVRGIGARIDADSRGQAPAGAARPVVFTSDVVRLRGVIDPTRYASERGPGAIIFTFLAIIVLLVCTTTVNSLLVGAAVARRYEFGVRLALGASRGRVIRQLLTEVALLSLVGGAIGMWLFGLLAKITEVSRDGFDVTPDATTVTFTVLYALLTAAMAGLTPALHGTRTGLAEILKSTASSSASRSTRLQRTFVVAQIAVAQPLMVILTAMMANFYGKIPELRDVELRERLLIAEFDTWARVRSSTPDQMPELLRRLRERPDVRAAMFIGPEYERRQIEPTEAAGGRDALPIVVSYNPVPPEYFATVGTRIVQGREFAWSDTVRGATIPVVLSMKLADSLFARNDPVGQMLRERREDGIAVRDMEVVGVADIREANGLDFPDRIPLLFVPYVRVNGGRVLIRTEGPAEPVIQALHQIARTDARLTPLTRVESLAAADRMRRAQKIGALGAGSGMAAVVLTFAAIGLYALLAIAVGQRTREIGVRIALGADAREVVRMFFSNGLRVTLIGLAFGLPFSLAGLAVFARGDGAMAWTMAAQAGALALTLVVGVGALASWIPARRAASVDPMIALRSE